MSLHLANYDPEPLPPPATTGPAPRGAQKITVAQAVERSRMNAGTIQKKCLLEWGPAGLAVMEKQYGTKAVWMIWDYADPRLARNASQQRQADDMTGFTTAQQVEAATRQIIVREWKNAVDVGKNLGLNQDQVTERFIEAMAAGRLIQDQSRGGGLVRGGDGATLRRSVSYRTLKNWRRDAGHGLAALVDGRGLKAEEIRKDDPYFAEVRHWYLNENEPRLSTVWRICQAKARSQGWELRSYHCVRRYIKSLPKSAVALARRGQEEYDNTYGGYVERDYTTLRVNQIWCGDHHPCDVIVHYKGKLVRPWISAWEDMRSRRVFYAFTPEPPDSNTVLAALVNGVKATGLRLPEMVYIDNGKDYDCYTLQGVTKAQRLGRHKFRVQVDPTKTGGVLGGLGIEVMHARPYNPKAKPVERLFRSYSDDVDRFEPTYTGNKPDNKPEGLEDKVRKFNEAVRGQSPANVAAGIGHVVPAFEDYVARATAWIEEEYHKRISYADGVEIDGLRCSPLDLYNHLLGESANHTISLKALEIAFLRQERKVKVGRNGQVNYDKRKYGRGQPEMLELQGQRVVVRVDPAEIKQVSIWNEQGDFVCHAVEVGKVPWGTSMQSAKVAARQNREQIRAAKTLRINPMSVVQSPTELIIANRQAENALRLPTPPPAPPGSFRPIQTGFEQQAAAYERSKARRTIMGTGTTGGGVDLAAAAEDFDDSPAPRSLRSARTLAEMMDDDDGDMGGDMGGNRGGAA